MIKSATAAVPPRDTASPHCQAMRNLLGETVTCTLDDGRTATGSLVCVDRLKNMILTNVIEERWVDSSVYNAGPSPTTTPTAADGKTTTTSQQQRQRIVVVKRELSQAMIPGKHLVKVHVRKSLYEQRVAPVLASSGLCDNETHEELI